MNVDDTGIDINAPTDIQHPCPYPIEKSKLRSVQLRTNAADIGADTIAAVCRWYTYGQTVHAIVRRVNNRRAVTDTIGMIDVYAILAIKIEQGLVSRHEKRQLAKDEINPAEFVDFYNVWREWKGEKWVREHRPEWNHLAIRAINRALNARLSTDWNISDEAAIKELKEVKAEIEKEADEIAAIDHFNNETLAEFNELEKKYPVLKKGKRVIAHGKTAFLVYGEDIKRHDRIASMNLQQREEEVFGDLGEVEQQELLLKAEHLMTPEEILKKEKLEEKINEVATADSDKENLPVPVAREELLPHKRTKEECEVIDTFADSFEFDFEDEGEIIDESIFMEKEPEDDSEDL